jgi:HAD superfamily hydrolase (TIGR01484 family)
MPFKPEGLLIDLDGTLIDRESRMSARVQQAVRRAAAHMPVAIASGREPDDVAHFARLLGLGAPQIADNGARIVDPGTGQTVRELAMTPAASQRIIGHLEAERLRYYGVDSGKVARSVAEFTAWNVTVIAAHAVDRATCDRLVADLAGDDVSAVRSTDANGDYWYANFTRRGVSKGSGAKLFATLTGLDVRGLVAIGDSHNDLPMFREVGLSVAMGHAGREVQEAADVVTAPLSGDGVAVAIEDLVLPRL